MLFFIVHTDAISTTHYVPPVYVWLVGCICIGEVMKDIFWPPPPLTPWPHLYNLEEHAHMQHSYGVNHFGLNTWVERERNRTWEKAEEGDRLAADGVFVFVSGADQLSKAISGERLGQSHCPRLYPGASQPHTAPLRHQDLPGTACRDNKETKTVGMNYRYVAQRDAAKQYNNTGKAFQL